MINYLRKKKTSKRKILFWLTISEVSVSGHMVPLFLGYSEVEQPWRDLRTMSPLKAYPCAYFLGAQWPERKNSVFSFSPRNLLLPAKPFFPTAHSARNPSMN